MANFDSAQDLLQPGETALCVFTDGLNFTAKPDGSGSTGNWKITPSRQVDCVVIFQEKTRDGQRIVELFRAEHDGAVGPDESGRCVIRLLGIQSMGSTERRWQEFAEAGQNPVRYVTKPTV